MVKVDTLYQIDVRLREIMGVSKPFGGVSLVLLGDPLQLRPVLGSYPWEEPKNEKVLWNEYKLRYTSKKVNFFKMIC